MRRLALIAIGIVIGVGGALGAQQALTDVETANQRFGDAARNRDEATYSQLVADDAEFVSPFGDVAAKGTRVAQIKAGAVAPNPVIFRDRPGYRVRMYDNTAILSWQDPATAERRGQRVVRVFVRQGPSWRLVHYQRTVIAPAPPR